MFKGLFVMAECWKACLKPFKVFWVERNVVWVPWVWKDLCGYIECDLKSRASDLSDWRVQRLNSRENTFIWVKQNLTWVFKSLNTHLGANGVIWCMRDMT